MKRLHTIFLAVPLLLLGCEEPSKAQQNAVETEKPATVEAPAGNTPAPVVEKSSESDLVNKAKTMGQSAWESTKEITGDVVDKSKEYGSAVADKSKEIYEAGKEKGGDMGQSVSESSKELWSATKEKSKEYYDAAKEKGQALYDQATEESEPSDNASGVKEI
ncbi:MAG: hypothetical protein ABW120_03610 [Sedimenticola sp.]